MLIPLVISSGVGVTAGFIAVNAKPGSTAANIAGIASTFWLFFFCASLVYAFAYTAFGPQGIRGRSLSGRYEYQWEQIDNVARRAYTSRGVIAYSVILTTTDGDRVSLSTPTSGGLLNDPEFDLKYARIHGAWQRATGRIRPDANTSSMWIRRLTLLWAGIIAQIIAVAVIASILQTYGPAFAAHEGRGTPGLFTAEIRNCRQPSCTWFGQFTSPDENTDYDTLAPGGPFVGQPNVTVPTVGTGAQYTVYPAGGGTSC